MLGSARAAAEGSGKLAEAEDLVAEVEVAVEVVEMVEVEQEA